MKFFVVSAILLILGFYSEPNENKDNSIDSIHWQEGKLTWKDFQGKAPSGTPYEALTYSAIDFKMEGEGSLLKVDINTVFDPHQSWKKDRINDYLLNHEQLHFDITEYHSRLLREKIQSLKFKSFDSIGSDIEKVFKKISIAADRMQEKYDHETDHSKVKEEQLKWDKKVAELLESKSAYTTNRLELDISYLN